VTGPGTRAYDAPERPASEPAPAPIVAVLAARLPAVAMLGASAIAWAALPMSGAYPGSGPVLTVAIASAVLAAWRLAASMLAAAYPGLVQRDAGYPGAGLAVWAWSGLRALPWAEGMTIAVLALEALHRSRPWHTVVLGVVLLAFLLALHLAESDARPPVLRPQLPLIAAGLALTALSAVAAALSAGGGLLAVIAAAAALAVSALALPV
jgi:hypothetical protein